MARAIDWTQDDTLKAQGLSSQQIATQLNREDLPTLSGRGQWQKGTVANLLAQED